MFDVMGVDDFEVTLSDKFHNISHVHQEGNGKWKCQRCNRYRCEHVQFVRQRGVQLLPRQITSITSSEDTEILTY